MNEVSPPFLYNHFSSFVFKLSTHTLFSFRSCFICSLRATAAVGALGIGYMEVAVKASHVLNADIRQVILLSNVFINIYIRKLVP